MTPLSLVERYGSPLYVYELAEARAAVAELKAALPAPARLFYSLKANPHPAIVAELGRLGCDAEVSSVGELRAALDAGIAPERCLHTGPAKTRDEISFALKHDVTWFSVESPRQLRRVEEVAEETGRSADVILRVNCDGGVAGYGLTMTGGASQFGADASWIAARPEEFRPAGRARLRGFHMFMGTNIPDEGSILAAFTLAIEQVSILSEAIGFAPDLVDLGGGFAHPFAQEGVRPGYAGLKDALEPVLDERLPGWRDKTPWIAFESGRYLVGGAGKLVCTVQDVKVSKGRRFVLLDSGIHHLGGMSGLRRLPQVVPSLRLETKGDDVGGDPIRTDVVGPLCTPLDRWAAGVESVSPGGPGDVVSVPNVGAYGLTGSLVGFLSHELPLEIVCDEGEVVDVSRLVVERQSEGVRR